MVVLYFSQFFWLMATNFSWNKLLTPTACCCYCSVIGVRKLEIYCDISAITPFEYLHFGSLDLNMNLTELISTVLWAQVPDRNQTSFLPFALMTRTSEGVRRFQFRTQWKFIRKFKSRRQSWFEINEPNGKRWFIFPLRYLRYHNNI